MTYSMETPFIKAIKMTGLMEAVRDARPPLGGFALFWLGQAGFIIKTNEGYTIAIDPCLSDYSENYSGYKRLTPPVCDTADFQCDTLLISHEHDDHYDVDLIEEMAKKKHFSRLFGPLSIEPLVQTSNLTSIYTRLEYNKPIHLPNVKVTPLFSDHGSETPNAMGFLFDFDGLRLYYAGDTAYSPQKLSSAFEAHPDVAIMPINGEFGNLDAVQAFALAKEMGCRALVPCHYWMTARHGSHPIELWDIAKQETTPAVVWLMQGEGWVVDPNKWDPRGGVTYQS